MKFVHAADVHLDSPLQGLALQDAAQIERVRCATRFAFEALIDFCIEQQVAFVVLAGDLYDRDCPNMQIAVFLRNQLARLATKGIRVVIAKGNHDANNKITSFLSLPDNTHILSDRRPDTVQFDDLPVRVAVHGQSFKSGPVSENLAAFYPAPLKGYFNLGILHTSLGGNADHDVYAPCKIEDLATRGYEYWALGHIHKGGVLARDPWIVYSGNLQGRHAKETGPKGCFLVEIENDKIASAELVPLDVVRWQQAEIDLGGKYRESELIECLRGSLVDAYRNANGRPSVVRLVLMGCTPLRDVIGLRPNHLRQTVLELAGEIGGDDLWIEKIHDDTTPPVAGTKTPLNEAASELIQIMREVVRDSAQIGPLLEKELQPLRTKLPEELKELPALRLLEDAGLAGDLLARVEPHLLLRLSGEEDVS